MKTNNTDHEIYFCLASDGLLYNLGDHGDYEAADATASSLGLEVIWMFGESTAQSWLDTLTTHLKPFHDGMDVHRATAAKVFDLTPDAVSSEQRRYAKAINFGLIDNDKH